MPGQGPQGLRPGRTRAVRPDDAVAVDRGELGGQRGLGRLRPRWRSGPGAVTRPRRRRRTGRLGPDRQPGQQRQVGGAAGGDRGEQPRGLGSGRCEVGQRRVDRRALGQTEDTQHRRRRDWGSVGDGRRWSALRGDGPARCEASTGAARRRGPGAQRLQRLDVRCGRRPAGAASAPGPRAPGRPRRTASPAGRPGPRPGRGRPRRRSAPAAPPGGARPARQPAVGSRTCSGLRPPLPPPNRHEVPFDAQAARPGDGGQASQDDRMRRRADLSRAR